MHTCTVSVSNDAELPNCCVVCGESSVEFMVYQQDNFPVILPGIGFVSWRTVGFPYCTAHGQRFRRRQKLLRVFQAVFFLSGLAVMALTEAVNNRDVSQLTGLRIPDAAVVVINMIGLGMIVLSAVSFFVKPFLYDASIEVTGTRVVISARSKEFIDRVAAHESGAGTVAKADAK